MGFQALAQGASWSGRERNRLFLNDHGQQFRDVSGVSALDDVGDGRVFATLDYNRDGWQDIVLLNNNSPAFVFYRNTASDQLDPSAHRFVAFRFVGGNTDSESSTKWSNRDGYGVRLTIRSGELQLVREHRCGEGLSAQNSTTMLVGIGKHAEVESVTVRWPSGKTQRAKAILASNLITVFEDPAQSPTNEPFIVEPYPPKSRLLPRQTAELAREQLRLDQSNDQSDRIYMYTTMATWCPNCKKLLPQLEQLRSLFTEDELTMLGVPIDANDDREKLSEYRSAFQPAYKLLLGLAPSQVAEVRRILKESQRGEGLPATIVTNSKGDVLLTTWGAPSVSEVRRLRFQSTRSHPVR